jgi:hypothetical protein
LGTPDARLGSRGALSTALLESRAPRSCTNPVGDRRSSARCRSLLTEGRRRCLRPASHAASPAQLLARAWLGRRPPDISDNLELAPRAGIV